MEPVPEPAALARIEALSARLDRPIALVGLMGAGKSTVGRRLAQMLGRSFIDADDARALVGTHGRAFAAAHDASADGRAGPPDGGARAGADGRRCQGRGQAEASET